MVNKIASIALAAMFVAAPLLTHADTLNRQLEVGMSGSDVSSLQTFLALDATLYPQGIVSGYFGFLTKAAVSNFQSRNGLPAVGRVGPATLPVLNLKMAGGMSSAIAPTITSVGMSPSRNSASVTWNTSELAKGHLYYSTNPLMTIEHLNSVEISGTVAATDGNFRTSQGVSLQNLQANTTYYYMVYTTDASGNVSVTWPSTFATTN